MTEKKRYIKTAFRNYNENKKFLRQCSFNNLKGVDTTRSRITATQTDGRENALIEYLDDKRDKEKQIILVDRVLWYYELDGKTEKTDFIRLRLIKHLSNVACSQKCYISEHTAQRWQKEIYELAERVCDMFELL